MPNNTLSTQPIAGAFLPPRNSVRFSAVAGMSDKHFGGVGLADASQGLQYQVWTCYTDGADIWLTAPNTPAFKILPGTNAVWVALAFDQNAREFIAYADANGNAKFYWYDTTIPGYTTTAISGAVSRVFAALDDARSQESASADVLLAYTRAGQLYYRQQRDRYGIEYDLAAVPATLVQIGMSSADRFQFAFQNVQGSNVLPPVEFQQNVGGALNVP